MDSKKPLHLVGFVLWLVMQHVMLVAAVVAVDVQTNAITKVSI